MTLKALYLTTKIVSLCSYIHSANLKIKTRSSGYCNFTMRTFSHRLWHRLRHFYIPLFGLPVFLPLLNWTEVSVQHMSPRPHVPHTLYEKKIKANDMYCSLQSIIITFEHFLVESNKILPDPLLYRFVKAIVFQENIQGGWFST